MQQSREKYRGIKQNNSKRNIVKNKKNFPKKAIQTANITAKTGDFPKELRTGILTLQQKPVKKVAPPENQRPVILLSNLCKILAITILNRCMKRTSC